MLITIGIAVGIVILLILLGLQFYVVVKPNQAHVVVFMGAGRKVYSPSARAAADGQKYSTAYFYIPILMQRIIVSLENVKHEINEIELRDLNVAPFKCDITCWFKITNPDLAAEKLDVDEDGNIMNSIRETLDAQVQGVTRASAMGLEVIDLMRDRKTFGKEVFEQVNGDLDEWGVQLVKLEIIDFSDTSDSHVIQDYEKRREAEIESETRKTVAHQNKEAEIKEAEARKASEQARIESEQAISLRDLDRDEKVGMREQDARLKVAMQQDKANERQVAAERTLTVGQSDYKAEAKEIEADGDARASIKKANGSAEGIKLEAKAKAEATRQQGTAEADIVAKKGEAEAKAIDKKAEAQKKFQDASKDVEFAKIAKDIEVSKYMYLGKALEQANINIVTDDIEFMGFGAKQGAGLGALLKNLQESSGMDLTKLTEQVKKAVGGKNANRA